MTVVLFFKAGPAMSGVARYEDNMHLGLTQFLAISVGLDVKSAIDIAQADRETDYGVTGPFASRRARALYHFVTQQRLDELSKDALSKCDVKPIGQWLHALEDSFSHEGYGPTLGHAFDGHTPDLAYLNPDKAMRMAQRKFSELQNVKQRCPKLGNASGKRWEDIQQEVRTMVEEK